MNHLVIVQDGDCGCNVPPDSKNVLDFQTLSELISQRRQIFHAKQDIISDAPRLGDYFMIFIIYNIRISAKLMHGVNLAGKGLKKMIIIMNGGVLI